MSCRRHSRRICLDRQCRADRQRETSRPAVENVIPDVDTTLTSSSVFYDTPAPTVSDCSPPSYDYGSSSTSSYDPGSSSSSYDSGSSSSSDSGSSGSCD